MKASEAKAAPNKGAAVSVPGAGNSDVQRRGFGWLQLARKRACATSAKAGTQSLTNLKPKTPIQSLNMLNLKP